MVGDFERTMKRTKEGVFTVDHDSLTLEGDAAGQGFATEWNKQAEDRYRRMGVQAIDLEATQVGSYAWARAGYDWRDENTTDDPDATRRENGYAGISMTERARTYLNSPEFKSAFSSDAEWKKFHDETLPVLEDHAARFARYAGGHTDRTSLPTPFEVSQVGYKEGAASWPGKAGMMRVRWSGRKNLNAAPENQISEHRAAGIAQSVTNIENAMALTSPSRKNLSFTKEDFSNTFDPAHEADRIPMAAEIFALPDSPYSTKITQVTPKTNSMDIHGTIHTEDGEKIGNFMRSFVKNEDGSISAHNVAVNVTEEHKGQGIAAALNKAAERAYKELGLKSVTVDTHGVGGFGYARAGYDWHHAIPFDMLYYVIKALLGRIMGQASLSNALGEYGGRQGYMDILERQHDELLGRLEAFKRGEITRDDPELPTPFELSQIGYMPGLTSWPGKEGLIGSNWSGEKKL
jgi:predicted GNAT family acetyltransferase